MPSNINPYNIDGTFPVANQDNSSQGFRDNFTNIRNNFLFAENEISDLQTKAVLTSALNGQTINNNMNGTKLTGPQLSSWTQTIVDLGNVATNGILDFSQGNFYKLTVSPTTQSINIELINWPQITATGTVGYGVMRAWIVTTIANQQIQLPTTVDIANDSLANYNSSVLTFDVPGDYIFDISSIDGGQNYMIQDLTRNRAWFVDNDFYYNPTVARSLFIGYGSFLPLAQAVESSASDAISVKGSISSYQNVNDYGIGVGNGDSSTAGGSNVNVPGYGSVVSRSYIDPVIGPVIKGVNPGDSIGEFYFQMGTGSPGVYGNITLADTVSIRSFAASKLPSYVTSIPDGYGGLTNNYSPGGNLQIMTKQDFGILGANTLSYAGWPRSDSVNYSGNGGVLGLAISVENDQSVKTWAATAKNYQFANLSAITGNITVNVSPYISTVILDSTHGATVSTANLQLGPSLALNDGQELNIISNCAVSTLSIVPFTGNVTVPVNKIAEAVGLNGNTVTYYFDNSGGVFKTGGYITASGFEVQTSFNGIFPITSYDAFSANINSSATGEDVGQITGSTSFSGNNSIVMSPTSLTAGSSTKFIYVAPQSKWYRA
jgi:hypothetical protein